MKNRLFSHMAAAAMLCFAVTLACLVCDAVITAACRKVHEEGKQRTHKKTLRSSHLRN